jgi:hypothetical protein
MAPINGPAGAPATDRRSPLNGWLLAPRPADRWFADVPFPLERASTIAPAVRAGITRAR